MVKGYIKKLDRYRTGGYEDSRFKEAVSNKTLLVLRDDPSEPNVKYRVVRESKVLPDWYIFKEEIQLFIKPTIII